MTEEERRRERARAMAEQCQGEHVVGDLICYCQLPMGHDGVHRDYYGRTFKKLFPWVGRWERHRKMMQSKA